MSKTIPGTINTYTCIVPHTNRQHFKIPEPETGQQIPIPRNFCMSMWQVQVCKTTIWTTISGLNVQLKIDEIFKDMTNIFGIDDDN